jgi:hypothetical protein
MLLTELPRRRLGVRESKSALRIGRADPAQPFSARVLFLSDKPAFELSLWCGTCPFLFERKEGANDTFSSEQERLSALEKPLSSVSDEVIESFGPLLPRGDYLPLLLELRPQLVAPNDERDYFTHEQVETWGIDGFWGLPENPRSFYYRTFETRVSEDEHLYEFVVPMVPPGWNDRNRVAHFRERLRAGIRPTAVALSTLDVCRPAVDNGSTDYYAHWGLTHFLLDGHHKMDAAAQAGLPVQLLALVSVDNSLASPDDIARLPQLLTQAQERREARGAGTRR